MLPDWRRQTDIVPPAVKTSLPAYHVMLNTTNNITTFYHILCNKNSKINKNYLPKTTLDACYDGTMSLLNELLQKTSK